jgi:hypothetical protein
MIGLHSNKSTVLAILFAWALCMSLHGTKAAIATDRAEQGSLRLYVVFNNIPYKAGLETGWGFSCDTKIAPSHCAGGNAIRMFRNEWADDFIEGGLGAVIEVPR